MTQSVTQLMSVILIPRNNQLVNTETLAPFNKLNEYGLQVEILHAGGCSRGYIMEVQDNFR